VILIVVKMPVKPEYAEQWPSLVQEFTDAARAEPGNISYEWFRSVEDPTLFTLVEVFRDTAAGEAHVKTPEFTTAMEALPKWLAAQPEIIHINSDAHEGWSRMAELAVEG
jgi:quinol monooxygenase YgiN